jgi:hypothetical protein
MGMVFPTVPTKGRIWHVQSCLVVWKVGLEAGRARCWKVLFLHIWYRFNILFRRAVNLGMQRDVRGRAIETVGLPCL